MFSADFLGSIACLRRPDMGTELAAQLLHLIARFTRAERMLEVGAGYTSPFLALAARENALEVHRERTALLAKTGPDVQIDDKWALTDPPLVDPAYHLSGHTFRVEIIEQNRAQAKRVRGALRAAGLDTWVELHVCNFRHLTKSIFAERSFRLAWFDCGGPQDYFDFLRLFWPFIDPDGELLLLHSILDEREGTVLAHLRRCSQDSSLGSFEILSLKEPQKFAQSSLTLLRRTAAAPSPPSDNFSLTLAAALLRTELTLNSPKLLN